MGAKKKGKKKGPPESGWWPGFKTKGSLSLCLEPFKQEYLYKTSPIVYLCTTMPSLFLF